MAQDRVVRRVGRGVAGLALVGAAALLAAAPAGAVVPAAPAPAPQPGPYAGVAIALPPALTKVTTSATMDVGADCGGRSGFNGPVTAFDEVTDPSGGDATGVAITGSCASHLATSTLEVLVDGEVVEQVPISGTGHDLGVGEDVAITLSSHEAGVTATDTSTGQELSGRGAGFAPGPVDVGMWFSHAASWRARFADVLTNGRKLGAYFGRMSVYDEVDQGGAGGGVARFHRFVDGHTGFTVDDRG